MKNMKNTMYQFLQNKFLFNLLSYYTFITFSLLR